MEYTVVLLEGNGADFRAEGIFCGVTGLELGCSKYTDLGNAQVI